MLSIVIQGKINKNGVITGPVPNSSQISRNEWDFKLVSLSIKPLSRDLKQMIEIGCSFTSSPCYNYELKKVLDKNSPLAVKYVDIERNKTQTFEFSDTVCPWLRIDQPSDRVDISIVNPGSDTCLSEDSAEIVCHMMIKRVR